jgi:type II secretory pathway component PulJ
VVGLTLVELLLALTLFTVLTGAVAALVMTGTKVQIGWGRSVEPYEQFARAMDRLQRDLESAQPFFGIPFTVHDEGTVLDLARAEPISDESGERTTEWVKVSYRIAQVGDGKALIRDEFLWKTEAAEVWRTETLTPLGTGQFSVGQVDDIGALTWTSAWDGNEAGIPQMPRLVKIDCALPTAGQGTPASLSRVFRNPAGVLLGQSP